MLTFVGKSFASVDGLLSTGHSVALGELTRKTERGSAGDVGAVIEELRRLAVDEPAVFEHIFELGRMAGAINCAWRRHEAQMAKRRG